MQLKFDKAIACYLSIKLPKEQLQQFEDLILDDTVESQKAACYQHVFELIEKQVAFTAFG